MADSTSAQISEDLNELKAQTYCITCGEITKYVCIQCSTSVCNLCSRFEANEELNGWEAGRSVAYCLDCNILMSDAYEGHDTDEKTSSRNASIEQTITAEHRDDSDSEQSDEDSPFLLKMQEKEGKENSFKVSKTRRKRKPGRKALWSADALNDMVDIITSDVCYRKKLIFTNTKNRNNGMVYSEILEKMKEQANKRGDQITFSIQQLRTKFKHCVSDCKQAAMTIKTATGIERFQDEKGFGKWFDLLFPLVKSRDSCKPDMAVEPSAITGNDLSEEEEVAKTLEDFVPTKKVKLPKKNKVTEAVELLKQVVDKDPAKELIQFMQEEAEKARNHELKLVELMLKHTSNNTTSNHVNLSPALDKPTMQSSTFQSIPQGQGSWTAPQHYNFHGNENPVYPLSTMNSSERFFNPFKTSFQHFGSK